MSKNDGGPAKCWQCRGPFNKRPDGSLVFATHVDAIGNEHRVHKSCGERLGPRYKPVTAQVGDALESAGETHDRLEDSRELRLAEREKP